MSANNNPNNAPLVACLIIINKEGKVLCVTRRHQQVYGLPGGKIDEGEALLVGASRELFEETNLKVNPNDWHEIYECHEKDDKPPYTQYWSTTFYVELNKVLNINELKQMEDGIVPAWLDWNEFFKKGVFTDYDMSVKKALDAYLG